MTVTSNHGQRLETNVHAHHQSLASRQTDTGCAVDAILHVSEISEEFSIGSKQYYRTRTLKSYSDKMTHDIAEKRSIGDVWQKQLWQIEINCGERKRHHS